MRRSKTRIRRYLLLSLVLSLPVLGSSYVCGQWEQTHKLIADDAVGGEKFGCSVSISEDTLVAGAYAADSRGSAYVFDVTTGEQLFRLKSDDAATTDWFGGSVSVSGNTIVVGAHGDDDAGSRSGSAYVFDATTGEQLHKLAADDAAAYDHFGGSVSVSGDLIVAGADCDDDAGSSSGSAYVFDAATGEQLHKLTANDAAAYDHFGYSVSISGNTIVVGAYRDDDAAQNSGSAYVFDATTGEQLRKLAADDAAASDRFGNSVSITGVTIVVGADRDDDEGSSSGSAYLFDAATGEQRFKLTADDGEEWDHFGCSVSVSGNTIVVGVHGDDDAGSNSGSAYVFDATTGGQLHKLTANDAAEEDWFGNAVSVSGNILVVGAYLDDGACPINPECDSGSAYVFTSVPPCLEDFNNDEVVDVLDLLAVLSAWGTCDPDCPEDITGDGIVDVQDLLEVLSAWGPCE